MAVKKSAKKTVAKKAVAKRGRPKNTGPAPQKRASSKKAVPAKRGRPAKKTAAKKSAPKVEREFDEVTGFVIGTDQHTIAKALMDGGVTRQEIIDDLKKTLDGETRNGTEKPVSNLVAGVTSKLLERGFTVEGSYALVPPVKRGRKRK